MNDPKLAEIVLAKLATESLTSTLESFCTSPVSEMELESACPVFTESSLVLGWAVSGMEPGLHMMSFLATGRPTTSSFTS